MDNDKTQTKPTYENLMYAMSALFPAPAKHNLDGSVTWTWVCDDPGPMRPMHVCITPEMADRFVAQHNAQQKERLASTVAESLGIPELPAEAKDELWAAVRSFFQEPPEDA